MRGWTRPAEYIEGAWSRCRKGSDGHQPEAGKPVDPSILVDVDALVGAYHDTTPDPGDPAQRVAFGTSGHRGSSFRGAFNEAHILAITEAICRYRGQRGYTGPLFLARDTHALSEPATRTALRGARRERRRRASRCLRRVHADAGPLPRDHRREPAQRTAGASSRTGSWSRRRTTRPTTVGSSTTRPTAARPTPRSRAGSRTRRIASSRRPGTDGVAGIQRVSDVDARVGGDAVRLHGDLRRRPRRRHRHGGDRRSPGLRIGVDPMGGASVRVLGRHRRAVRPRPDGHQRQGRPAVRVHDRRLGRQDPDGPVVAVCDGPPRGPARRVRHRARQRRRRGPPRRRDPDRRAARTRTTSCPRRSPTCSAGRAAGATRSRSARRSSRPR